MSLKSCFDNLNKPEKNLPIYTPAILLSLYTNYIIQTEKSRRWRDKPPYERGKKIRSYVENIARLFFCPFLWYTCAFRHPPTLFFYFSTLAPVRPSFIFSLFWARGTNRRKTATDVPLERGWDRDGVTWALFLYFY